MVCVRIMEMGMLTTFKATCARVILMALTGDGSMSTNCCTELRVWHHTHTHTPHTRTEIHPRAAAAAHRHVDRRVKVGGKC